MFVNWVRFVNFIYHWHSLKWTKNKSVLIQLLKFPPFFCFSCYFILSIIFCFYFVFYLMFYLGSTVGSQQFVNGGSFASGRSDNFIDRQSSVSKYIKIITLIFCVRRYIRSSQMCLINPITEPWGKSSFIMYLSY